MGVMGNEITVQQVIELVRFEFRRYGYRADGGTIVKNNNGMAIEFEAEPATGQSSFSQDMVTPHFRIWVSDLPMEPTAVVPLKPSHPAICTVDVSVSYTHHGGGSNGVAVRYELLNRFLDAPTLRRRA